MSGVTSLWGWRRLRMLGLLVVVACALAACAPAPATPGDGWVRFGPFRKPAAFAADPGVTGRATVWAPRVGRIHLEARKFVPQAEIRGTTPTVESERYTYAYNGNAPMLVGVVEVVQTLHYRRSVAKLHSVYVLGLSVATEPKVLTTWLAYRGDPATVTLTGLTDQGVVPIFLQGKLHGTGEETRLDGVDVARGTDVWWKVAGYPAQGPVGNASRTTATFYTAPAVDACATKVEEYEIASGVTIHADAYPTGLPCRRADGH